MKGWKGWASTLAIVFVTGAIGYAVTVGLDVQGNWRGILIAGISAMLTTIINAINPADTRYGVGASSE